MSISSELVRVGCALCGADRSVYERTLEGFTLERCRRCGFVFTNPRSSPDTLADLYSERDAAELIPYYARVASPAVIAGYQRRLRLLTRWLPGRGRLLDFGCGAGYFVEQAACQGWESHGTDLGAWAEEAAARREVRNIRAGYLRDLNFPDCYFDVVHSSQVLEHLENPLEDLAEIRRILRPGGLLYVDVPNYRTLTILLGKDDFYQNTPPQHLNYFTPGTLARLLTAANFRCSRLSTEGGLKWENLLGRQVPRDLLPEEGHPNSGRPCFPPISPPFRDRLAALTKQAILASVVRPVFYNWLKVGMLLVAVARRP